MKTRSMRPLTTLAAALLFSLSLFAAQPQPQAQAPLTAAVPTDPQIITGAYENGMRFYVRANKKPEKRAELRLVVKAGSILEEDDQLGLAHFVEHMAFNGTTHFPGHQLEEFMESIGMRFGADLNASTSYDQTIYTLRAPTDNMETLDKALTILEDWAHNVTFDAAEIEKERGVVMEEWRLRRGAGARTNEKLDPIILKDSRYADRLPIGKPEIIQGFKPERLKKFYSDWYRPDLMAVIVVGDFDQAAVEKMVRARFAPIPAAKSPRPRPSYDTKDHAGVVYAVVTDKEATDTSVEVDNLFPGREQQTIGAYRQNIIDGLFSGMLSARFSEMAQKPDPPFIFAGAGRGEFLGRPCDACPAKEQASLFAQVKNNGVERGLDALFTELERVSRFGFTATELDRQKQNLLRSFERVAAEEVNRPSASRADEYIRNFIDNEPLPTAATEYALTARFLAEIALADVTRIAKEWFPGGNRFVVVTAPEKAGVTTPTEANLATVIKSVSTKELKPYVDSVGSATLVETLPSTGTVVKTTTKDAIGVTEWELSNGVKVVLKPTTFREDEIVFRATSPGGTSLVSDADYLPASAATQLVTAGGLGKFDAIDLRKAMTGKVASVSPFISELEEGLAGSGSRKDLETMFQLIYLRFTQPRADSTAVDVMKEQARADLANQTSSPEFAFSEAFVAARYQSHPRRRITTAEMVDSWNLDKAMSFYKDRFADASDFTFVFVGSFDLGTMRPFVEKYLGALPSTRRKETWKDINVRPPSGIVEKTVEKGVEPRGRTTIVFSGPFEWGETRATVPFRAMVDILQRRLLDTIREELGGAYTISASQGLQKTPNPEYSVTIQFGHDPERVNALVRRIFQEIEEFKAKGPTEGQVNDERAALLRDFETSSQQNGFVLNMMTTRYRDGEDPAAVWKLPEYYKALSTTEIQSVAKKYLDTTRYVKVTLLPEKK